MRFGPGLIIRGTFVGCILIALLGYAVTANAAPLANLANSQPQAAAAQPTAVSVPVPAQPSDNSGANNSSAPASQGSGDCKVSDKFPASVTKWCDLITRYAAEQGLAPNLIAAVILQESGGNPTAYSHSGAVGLMQVMPNDGLAASFMCAAGPCFASRPSTSELQDPEFNISYGTRMLAGLISKNGGDIREALKSYGPKDVGYYYADIILGIFNSHQ